MTVYQIFYGTQATDMDLLEMCNEGFTGLSSEISDKLRAGINKLPKAWEECVPYFVHNKFAFKNENALRYFLFELCGLTYDDIDELHLVGYNVLKIEVDCLTAGLSNTVCTIDTDEIKSVELLRHYDIINDYYIPRKGIATKAEKEYARNQYYDVNIENGKDAVARYAALV